MKITFLGTGTSVGIPAIGCSCDVCLSDDPRNKRRRSSLYVEGGGVSLMVDTPPDFREQALAYQVPRVDGVLFTHSHADHVLGFDDIRRYNTIQECVIPAYASSAVIADLKRIFCYIDEEDVPGTYTPRIDYVETHAKFEVGGLRIDPLLVQHGAKATQGYLFRAGAKSFGYVPDCHVMPDEVVEALQGIDVMILNALRNRPHPTHLTLDESLGLLARIGAKRSLLIHMAHDLDHAETERRLPDTVSLSYDGQVLEW